MTAEEHAAKVVVSHDDFKKFTRLTTFPLRLDQYGLVTYYFGAIRNDGESSVETYLIFDCTRFTEADWAFWEEAIDGDGKPLKVSKISRDVLSGGMTREVISIDMPRAYLEAAVAGAGWKFRIDGKHAQQVVTPPPVYIAGFLKSVDDKLLAKSP